jgi:hypothetical protein
MTDEDIILAARVPMSVRPQSFGLWHISRDDFTRYPLDRFRSKVGFDFKTNLHHASNKSIHLTERGWDIVMEDSIMELRKHLPIFRRANGNILITGLGLGCVVRGLLTKSEVRSIDIIEIDKDIIRIIGQEFADNPRIKLHHADALEMELPKTWDYAWHDLWTDGDRHLQLLHADLFCRFQNQCKWQGAWHFPGNMFRKLPWANI